MYSSEYRINKILTFVAGAGTPSRLPPFEKAIRAALNLSMPVAFWGWRRSINENVSADLGVCENYILFSGLSGGYRKPLGWLFFGLSLFINVLRTKEPRVYIALDLQTAVWIRAAVVFKDVDFIFYDADRMVHVLSLPLSLRNFLAALERSVSRRSLAHVVPVIERYDYRSAKFFVIENQPDQDLVRRSLSVRLDLPKSNMLVYVSGWIGPSRGSGMIIRAAKKLINDGIVFVVAAKTFDDTAVELTRLPNVHYLGYVPQYVSLAWCRACHVSLTLYDPSRRINQYAAPNKWGDAMFCERPFIVNCEVKTAYKWLLAGAAFSVRWDDDMGLANSLLLLRDNKGILDNASLAMACLRESAGDYDERISCLFDFARIASMRHSG